MIVPNPESALNEDAGRLLLERYEDYAKRAAMHTQIHASIIDTCFDSGKEVDQSGEDNENNSRNIPDKIKNSPSKRSAPDMPTKGRVEQKKRSLKRL